MLVKRVFTLLFLFAAIFATVYALVPGRRNAGLNTEEIEKCSVQAHLFFENVVERLLVRRFAISGGNAFTYYIQAYLPLGIPYDGAVIHASEPYSETKYAGEKYIENQWNCEGSMTRVGFRQAAP